MMAISSYFAGGVEYSDTCDGSMGVRGFPVMTRDVVAQPASAKIASHRANDRAFFEVGFTGSSFIALLSFNRLAEPEHYCLRCVVSAHQRCRCFSIGPGLNIWGSEK